MEIGFSQRIRLEWLERTTELVLAGYSRKDVKLALDQMLQDRLSVGSNPERGNREKAITILLRTWVSVPKPLECLRDDGLALLQQSPPDAHLPLHWGMTMAAYPFFGAVAETVGRLLRLQGSFAAAEVQRRIRERFGERETVARAARRVLRCFVDWGVLKDTTAKGRYEGAAVHVVRDRKVVVWLIEAALIAGGSRSSALRALVHYPSLFPYDLGLINAFDLNGNSRFELLRQGLDEDVVMLRKPRVEELTPRWSR